MLRLPLISLFLWTLPAVAAGPASLQVCLSLPAGVPLFSETEQPSMRSLEGGTWMLNFELKLNGRTVERITRSGPDCFRAWVPAQRLTRLAIDFGHIPLNLADQERAIDIQLEADRWSNAGRVVISRAPWASVANDTTGTLTLERTAFVMGDPKQLPAGPYRLKFIPAAPNGDCPIALKVLGSGTIRADRHEVTYQELSEVYRKDVVPFVVARRKLKCRQGEAAQLSVRLDDGVFRTPFDPVISPVSVEVKLTPLQFSVDGVERPFVNGMSIFVKAGQRLKLADLSLHAAR